jgi:hypothetical protein
VSFSFGGRLAAYGAGNEPLGKCAQIDSHDSPRDETRWEEGHRGEVERLHAPGLERERPLTGIKSS